MAWTPSDAELVAYLDGELSPADSVRIAQKIAADAALSARVETLQRGMRPFGQAFGPLLAEAPNERLEGALARALEHVQSPASSSVAMLRRHWGTAAAAAVVMLALGAGIDRFVASPLVASVAHEDPQADWRRAVARYLALYTSDTLALIPDSDEARRQELVRVGAKLGIDLTPARVELAALSFKRADMFDYDGKPLAFLAYLDPKSGPVALCIMPDFDRPAPPMTEHRRGMNVVYWAQAHHGFMLIGHADTAALQAMAATVADRFGTSGPSRSAEDKG